MGGIFRRKYAGKQNGKLIDAESTFVGMSLSRASAGHQLVPKRRQFMVVAAKLCSSV